MRGRRLRLASEAHSGNQTLAPAPVSFSIERIGVTTLDMITQLTSWTHHEDGGGQG